MRAPVSGLVEGATQAPFESGRVEKVARLVIRGAEAQRLDRGELGRHRRRRRRSVASPEAGAAGAGAGSPRSFPHPASRTAPRGARVRAGPCWSPPAGRRAAADHRPRAPNSGQMLSMWCRSQRAYWGLPSAIRMRGVKARLRQAGAFGYPQLYIFATPAAVAGGGTVTHCA